MTKSRLLQLAVFATTLPLWAALERIFSDPLARCIALWAVFALLWGGVEFAARKGKVLLPVEKNTFTAARRVFAIAFSAIFLVAFWSWGSQVRGLVGEQGLLPVGEQLLAVQKSETFRAIEHPTLCWLGHSDTWLLAQCWLGAFYSIALAAGFCPGVCALVCWALYLSLMSVGGPFSNFQWDALLLETAPLAAAWLPWSLRPQWGRDSSAQKIGRWLLWWLFFRLMIQSGIVKLTWNDTTWLNYTALDFHFETQPLPLWTSWFAHQWPAWLHRAMCWVMYWIEIATPILLFAPPRWRTLRHSAALAQIALQLAIIATGNYTYFNWLTIALCLPFLDDTTPFLRRLALIAESKPAPRWPLIPACAMAAASVALSFGGMLDAFGGAARQEREMKALRADYEHTGKAPQTEWWKFLRTFNGYGLFRTMTTARPEIILEGSDDGRVWREYEFPYKAGNLYRSPSLVAPHQPRLDWQMWFAALHPPSNAYWLEALLRRVLESEPTVLALLEKNPFPNEPPRFVRMLYYDYHFTRAEENPVTWWKRELKGVLIPAVSLENFRKK